MRSQERTIGELIQAYMRAVKSADYIDSQRIINSWSLVVGDFIASHTIDLSFSNNKLFVRFDSDVIRNEMSYSRSALMRHLNAIAGRELVKAIVFS